MELKIINKKEDPLLSRTKVEIEITLDKATPSKAEIMSLESKKDCTLIDRVNSFLITTEYHNLYGRIFHTLNTGPVNLIDPQSLFEEEIKIEFLEMKINKTSPQKSIIC